MHNDAMQCVFRQNDGRPDCRRGMRSRIVQCRLLARRRHRVPQMPEQYNDRRERDGCIAMLYPREREIYRQELRAGAMRRPRIEFFGFLSGVWKQRVFL